MTIKQTAGRDALGDFAPKFAQLNDDVLFGEVWSREDRLSLRDRSVVTVVALMAIAISGHLRRQKWAANPRRPVQPHRPICHDAR